MENQKTSDCFSWNKETCLANAELHPLERSEASNPALFVLGECVVSVLPFRWHACLVTLSPVPQTWEPIWRWFDQWFDLEEERPPDSEGFSGVVHRIRLHRENGESQIEIDLGSAPVAALLHLLSACSTAGSTSVRLTDVPEER